MLEKIFAITPDWLKSKVMVRIVYTAGSFLTARVVAFLTGDYLNTLAAKFVAAGGHIGIILEFKVVSVDQRTLEAAITGILMIVAEFVISHIHENTVKPAILASSAEVPSAK